MKNEIKILRKCQKLLSDLRYPGYPFQVSIVIDLEEQSAWINYCGKKQPLVKALQELYASLMFVCLEADNTSKKTFLTNQHLEPYEKYLEYDSDNFYIGNINACRLYFALNSAVYNNKKSELTGKYIFACMDEDTEYVEVKLFTSLEQVQQFYNDYFKEAE